MKKIKVGIAAVALAVCLQAPAGVAQQAAHVEASPQAAPGETTQKSGLVKVKKKYYYYKNGKKVKNKWVTAKVKGKKYKYYFGKNGAAYTGVKKIKKTTYCFNAKGQMQKNCWYKNTYYLGKTGAACKGICVVKGKLYAFGTNGKKDAGKTKILQQYSVQGADAARLKEILGEPLSAEYASSCMMWDGHSGDDGIWNYQGFTVCTFRYSGKEIVWMCY